MKLKYLILLSLIACGKPKPVETIESLKAQLEAKDKEIELLNGQIEALDLRIDSIGHNNYFAETRLTFCKESVELLAASIEYDSTGKLPRTLGYALAKAKVVMRNEFILNSEEDYDEIRELWESLSVLEEETEEDEDDTETD